MKIVTSSFTTGQRGFPPLQTFPSEQLFRQSSIGKRNAKPTTLNRQLPSPPLPYQLLLLPPLLPTPLHPLTHLFAGKVEAETVKTMLDTWGIAEKIIACGFDTTSSNTGVLQQLLGRQILWVACRHHILELVLKAVQTELFGDTVGPEESFFKFMKPSWTTLDLTDIRRPTIPTPFKADTASLLTFIQHRLKPSSSSLATWSPGSDHPPSSLPPTMTSTSTGASSSSASSTRSCPKSPSLCSSATPGTSLRSSFPSPSSTAASLKTPSTPSHKRSHPLLLPPTRSRNPLFLSSPQILLFLTSLDHVPPSSSPSLMSLTPSWPTLNGDRALSFSK